MSLAEVRKSRGFSAVAMANSVGITVQELLAIERGQQYPRLCVAQKWANALGISFEEFARHFYEKADPEQLKYCECED